MLKTKLNKPYYTSKLIFRKDLIDKFEKGKEKKLTLVSAPAGYGKSTAVIQWINNNIIQYFWYSLDKSDNDINNFLQYTIAGIQSVHKNIGIKAIKMLDSRSSPSIETISTNIINEFCDIEEQFYMIFDDYHLIENQQINQFISFLIDNLPENIHIILITRSDPSIPLARLRSQQLISDIRLTDLCFNSNSIHDFFKNCLDIKLTTEETESLEKKTEGWIAGLQLTGLSMQGKEDIGEFVSKLKGDNRHIMDYLIEEVLQKQDPQMREFLLCTSILNQFNASLCNHLLNINNAQEIIEKFEKSNMFIIPLDNERNWFRYHHLFASLLQHWLRAQLKERIPKLHSKASQWFENNEYVVFALEHSLSAGNKAKALNHFANVINQLWEKSQYHTILQFGGMFNHEELINNIELCLNYFWILFQSGFQEQAESLIYLLKGQTTNKEDLAKVYVCINNLRVFKGDIEGIYNFSDLSTNAITRGAEYWNILAYLSLGEADMLKLELSKSYKSFYQAAVIASESNLVYFEMINSTRASHALSVMGDYAGAFKSDKDLLSKLQAIADDNFGIEVLSSILNCKIGIFLIDTNQIEEGLQKCIKGYELAKKTTNVLFITTCTLLLANAYYLVGEYEKAVSYLEELDNIAYSNITKYLCILADSLKCKLLIKIDKQDKLKSLFEKKIDKDKNHAFERIVHNLCKGRYQISEGKLLDSINLLKEFVGELETKNAYGLLTETELLLAKAYSQLQHQENALGCLIKAILQTQSANLIRLYINEGTEIENLLKDIKHLVSTKVNSPYDKIDIDYLNRLLRVFEKEKSKSAIISNESLSTRELDTLKLIAENLTNQEIADALFISITTVKTHVRNILLKLEAKNRIEAVSIARDKGISY